MEGTLGCGAGVGTGSARRTSGGGVGTGSAGRTSVVSSGQRNLLGHALPIRPVSRSFSFRSFLRKSTALSR
jgi:hypothetical protein